MVFFAGGPNKEPSDEGEQDVIGNLCNKNVLERFDVQGGKENS